MSPAMAAEIVRGDTHTMEVRVWADEDKTQPYDLTGAESLSAELRSGTGTPVLAEFAVALVTPPNVLHLTLDSTQTAGLPFGATLSWDVQAQWAGTPPTVLTVVRPQMIKIMGDITDSDAATPAAARRVR